MALILRGKTPCSICGKVLEKGQELVAFPAFLFPGDELWKYSDSAMHKSCYDKWEHRELMTQKFSQFTGEIRHKT